MCLCNISIVEKLKNPFKFFSFNFQFSSPVTVRLIILRVDRGGGDPCGLTSGTSGVLSGCKVARLVASGQWEPLLLSRCSGITIQSLICWSVDLCMGNMIERNCCVYLWNEHHSSFVSLTGQGRQVMPSWQPGGQASIKINRNWLSAFPSWEILFTVTRLILLELVVNWLAWPDWIVGWLAALASHSTKGVRCCWSRAASQKKLLQKKI